MAAISDDFRKADLPQKDIAMLEYAAKLSVDPCAIERKDLKPLRQQGFRDSDILDIVLVAAYYAYVNRIASGLGVELEGFWGDGEP